MNHHLVDQIWRKLDFSILHLSHYNQRGLGISPLMQQLSHARPCHTCSCNLLFCFVTSSSCPCHQTLSWEKKLWNGCFKVFPIIVHAQYYQQNFHNFTFDSVARRILWMVPICWMGLPPNLTDKRNPHIWSMESRDMRIFDKLSTSNIDKFEYHLCNIWGT